MKKKTVSKSIKWIRAFCQLNTCGDTCRLYKNGECSVKEYPFMLIIKKKESNTILEKVFSSLRTVKRYCKGRSCIDCAFYIDNDACPCLLAVSCPHAWRTIWD